MDHVTGSTITNYIEDDMASIVGGNSCLPFYFCSSPPQSLLRNCSEDKPAEYRRRLRQCSLTTDNYSVLSLSN